MRFTLEINIPDVAVTAWENGAGDEIKRVLPKPWAHLLNDFPNLDSGFVVNTKWGMVTATSKQLSEEEEKNPDSVELLDRHDPRLHEKIRRLRRNGVSVADLARDYVMFQETVRQICGESLKGSPIDIRKENK